MKFISMIAVGALTLGACSSSGTSGVDAPRGASIDAAAHRIDGNPLAPDANHATPDAHHTTQVDAGSDAVSHLTFSGCSPDMTDLVVTTNTQSFDSIGVTNGSAPLNGSVTVALTDSTPRTASISTTERTQNSDDIVLNVSAGGVYYTNLCYSGGGCSYNAQTQSYDNDPITGSLVITSYDPPSGVLDVQFESVVLQGIESADLCTVNGRLQAFRLTQ